MTGMQLELVTVGENLPRRGKAAGRSGEKSSTATR